MIPEIKSRSRGTRSSDAGCRAEPSRTLQVQRRLICHNKYYTHDPKISYAFLLSATPFMANSRDTEEHLITKESDHEQSWKVSELTLKPRRRSLYLACVFLAGASILGFLFVILGIQSYRGTSNVQPFTPVEHQKLNSTPWKEPDLYGPEVNLIGAPTSHFRGMATWNLFARNLSFHRQSPTWSTLYHLVGISWLEWVRMFKFSVISQLITMFSQRCDDICKSLPSVVKIFFPKFIHF